MILLCEHPALRDARAPNPVLRPSSRRQRNPPLLWMCTLSGYFTWLRSIQSSPAADLRAACYLRHTFSFLTNVRIQMLGHKCLGKNVRTKCRDKQVECTLDVRQRNPARGPL